MEMTLSEVLAKIKITDKKIERSLTDLNTVVGLSGNQAPPGFDSRQAFISHADASIQSIDDLISFRDKLKAALVGANASTFVTILGEKMTIAAAVERRNLLDFRKKLFEKILREWSHVKNKVDAHNQKLESDLSDMVAKIMGERLEPTAERYKSLAQALVEQHQAVLVHPVDLKLRLQKMQDYLDKFTEECDFTLSVANATTKVEV